MVTGETFVTVETTVGRPTNTDALADLESLGGFAEGDDCAYRFVTGNEWVPIRCQASKGRNGIIRNE